MTRAGGPQCSIPEPGGIALFSALANGNRVLRVLSLSNNGCGNASAKAAGEMLHTITAVAALDLSWNQIKVRPRHVKA